MKHTAIEELVEDLTNKGFNFKLYEKEIRYAKELEKKQIIDACNQTECFGSFSFEGYEDITKGDEYYNVNFKNK
jgi:hypothetical protein